MRENDLAREYSVAHGGPIRNIALERKALTTETVAGQVASILQRYGVDCIFGQSIPSALFLANVVIGNALHNILYVATEHASVYAFDADTGAQIWHVSVLGSGETTSDNRSCSQITPEIGITSTPVIDRKSGANGTVFTVAMSKDSSGVYHQRLHALDLTGVARLLG